jgi:hypothetical protein
VEVIENHHPEEHTMYRTTNRHHVTRRHHVSRRQLSTVAAATALAATATILSAPSASAGHTAAALAGEEPFSRPCFMVQANWNEALDGGQPECPAPPRATSTSSTESGGEPVPLYGHAKRGHR